MASQQTADQMIRALTNGGFEWLLTVPATGLEPLYKEYERRGRCLYCTREEEAIALATGFTLGGVRSIVVMQQTGVGNCINAVLSLSDAYQIRFPVLVCDRSVNDPNLVQRVSSLGTSKVLEALGSVHLDWTAPGANERFQEHVKAGVRWIVCSMAGAQ